MKTFFFPSGRRTYDGAELVMSTVYADRIDRFPVHTLIPQVKLDMPNDTYRLFWHLELWLIDRRRERV